MKTKLHIVLILTLSLVWLILPQAECMGATTSQISQFGITWTFDKEYECGQFANGDYWVVGPVTVTSVSPEPSSGRNGSMINPMTGSSQGYDSRIDSYDSSLSVSFPKTLQPGESLVSTESLTGTDCSGGNIDLMGTCVWSVHAYLKNAAVLTVLASAPPTDSFRPPFVGSEKPIYTTSQLQRQILPKLAKVPSTPPLATYERYLQRPWLNHKTDWTCRMMHPTQNMPNYYREAFLIYSTVPLLLSLDFTDQEKETLLIRFVQLGIDQYATILNGSGDRMIGKGPIALVGLLLNDSGMLSYSYGYREVRQTYYYDDPSLPEFDKYGNKLRGQLGWTGATALWGSKTVHPHEHIHPSQWLNSYTDTQGPQGACKLDGYRFCCSSLSFVGEALAGYIIPGLKEAWNHPAFFDYIDRWMTEDVPWDVIIEEGGCSIPPWVISWEKSPGSTFIGDMWDTYRADYPPVAVITANPISGEVPLTVYFDGSASYDPDGSIVSYEWEFGDGTTSTEIKPSHIYTSVGEYTVTLSVTDDQGFKGESQIHITVFQKAFGELPTGCYNNVFNPAKGERALIIINLQKQARVKISLYDTRGNRIRELADEEKDADVYQYYWDGKDDSGNVVGSGLYFVHIQAGDYKVTKKIVVVK